MLHEIGLVLGNHALLMDKANVFLDGAVLLNLAALEAVVLSASNSHLLQLAFGDFSALGTLVCLTQDVFLLLLLLAVVFSADFFAILVIHVELVKEFNIFFEFAFLSQLFNLLLNLLVLAHVVV